ncbi:LicD family protein [Paenibacillus polygoni]|uniref:LicD family protein n=1 Tax=Paenibacillus polygoni TaxID=3050112 RepID=A0ABY8X6S7_9BACL|nr:LicD family protein [Paenibacillus polygoni]WIV18895.1 LicD family protein [Paenibacillus polygoni]
MNKKTGYLRLSEYHLKKLQKEMLLLLLEVDRICRKHNIQYFLAYGTLIGAVRHGSFIPWDDDVDIEMLREDYEKFCELCKTELDHTKFSLQNQQTDQHYNWVFGKLKLKNTSYVRSGQEHLKQQDGIFIDIFPLDHITDNRFKQRLTLLICKVCRKILWAQVGKKNASQPLLRGIYKLLSYIPRSLIVSIFNFMAKCDNRKNTSFLVSHNYLSGYIFKREWYDSVITLEFEGHLFYAPKGYDKTLSMIYGEYMKLPPVEKRQGNSHASFIKFLDGTELKF